MSSDEQDAADQMPIRTPLMIDLRFIEQFASVELAECASAFADLATTGRRAGPTHARAADLVDAVARMLLEIVAARDEFHREMGGK